MKKEQKRYIIVGLIVLGVILFTNSSTLMLVPDNSQVAIEDVFFGTIPVHIESTYLGTLTNSKFTGFCGNDGDVTISNSFSNYKLSSSMVASGQSCSGNTIFAEFTTEKSGTVTGNCNLITNSIKPALATTYCSVYVDGGKVIEIFSKDERDDHSMNSKNEGFSVSVQEGSKVKIELVTSLEDSAISAVGDVTFAISDNGNGDDPIKEKDNLLLILGIVLLGGGVYIINKKNKK